MRFKEFKTESIIQPVQHRTKPTHNPPKQMHVPPEKNKPKYSKDKLLVDLITEKKRRKKKKTKLARYFYPGFGYYGYGSNDSNSGGVSGDGGGDGGGMEESKENRSFVNTEVDKFAKWACGKLHIKNPPKIELSYDTEEAQSGHHTGKHIHGSDSVWVYANNRNLVDILRTVFHELVHIRQGELNMVKLGSSYPGSPIEAMADMLAGKYIKIYGKANRKIFQ